MTQSLSSLKRNLEPWVLELINQAVAGNSITIGGGGVGLATPEGTNSQIQYNDNGLFGGAGGLLWDDVGDNLRIKAADGQLRIYETDTADTNDFWTLGADDDIFSLSWFDDSASTFDYPWSGDTDGNFAVGYNDAWGTNAENVLALINGTAPDDSPANLVQLYSADESAKAALKVRDEAGNVWSFQQDKFVSPVPLYYGGFRLPYGSAANDQVAIWAGANNLDGSSSLTFDGTVLTLSGIAPAELLLYNTTEEDTDGGRETDVTWQGEDSLGSLMDLARIRGAHAGAGTDDNGQLRFYVNSGGALTERMNIDSAGVTEFLNKGLAQTLEATTQFLGPVVYGGTGAGDDLTLESTSNATKGDVLLQPNGGYVGVGDSTPAVPLNITGDFSSQNDVGLWLESDTVAHGVMISLSQTGLQSWSFGMTDASSNFSVYDDRFPTGAGTEVFRIVPGGNGLLIYDSDNDKLMVGDDTTVDNWRFLEINGIKSPASFNTVIGLDSRPSTDTAVSYIIGVRGLPQVDDTAITVTNAYSLYATNPSIGAAATLTNAYGLRIDSITAGSSANYAILTSNGVVEFGDVVGIGTSPISNRSLSIQMDHVGTVGIGLQVLEDNSSTATKYGIYINEFDNATLFAYGLYIEDITVTDGGSHGWAIMTGAGEVWLGDKTTVGNTAPELVLYNTTEEDADGGRESSIVWTGEDNVGNPSDLVQIEGSHAGIDTDEDGQLVIYVNSGSALTQRMSIDGVTGLTYFTSKAQAGTLEADIQVIGPTVYGGSGSGDDLTLESTSNATKGDVLLQPNGGYTGVGLNSPNATFEVAGTNNPSASILELSGTVTATTIFNVNTLHQPSSGANQVLRLVSALDPQGSLGSYYNQNVNLSISGSSSNNVTNVYSTFGRLTFAGSYGGTVSNYVAFYSDGIVDNSSGSPSVTVYTGFWVGAETFGNNNRAFRGQIASGSNRYNLYMDGDADNYLAGQLGIGTTPSVKLDVSGEATISDSLVVGNAAHNDFILIDVAETLSPASSSIAIGVDVAVTTDTALTTLAGVYSLPEIEDVAITVANAMAFEAKQPSVGASATLTNAYGLFVDNILTGTNNYAIYTKLGQIRFGDDVGIGSTATPTANGGKVLFFGDNTADPTMDTNTAGVYAKDVSGTVEIFVIDEADNASQISPHDPETGEWVFYSKNLRTGKVLKVQMEKLVKFLDDYHDLDFVEEFTEAA